MMNKTSLKWHVGVWSDDLLCFWIAWTVVTPDELRLDLANGSCADMCGAIRVGKTLMPDVRKITVFEAGAPVQLYICSDNESKSFRVAFGKDAKVEP